MLGRGVFPGLFGIISGPKGSPYPDLHALNSDATALKAASRSSGVLFKEAPALEDIEGRPALP